MRNKLFSYFGAKTKLLPTLYKRLPSNYREMINIEVFGGSGVWMYNKPKAYIEVYNDYNKGLSAIFWCLVHDKEAFFEKLKYIAASREIFLWYDDYEPDNKLDLAVKSAYKIHFSFSGRIGSTMFRPSLYRLKGDNKHVLYEEALWDNWAERFRKVYIDNADFEFLLDYYNRPRAFFYCDPPYFISTEASSGYYDTNFTSEDHNRLFASLHKIKGKWLLSYDDHPEVRELYKDYNIEEVYIKYQARGTRKDFTKELLISNYKTNYDLTQHL